MNQVILPLQTNYINYIYSYELDSKLSLSCIKRLTGKEKAGLTITNSGTASISLVTSILSVLGMRRVLVISPTYFATFYNCYHRGMEVRELYMLRSQNGYQLPRKAILQVLAEIDVLWITNPVYNTSVYMSIEDEEFLIEYVMPSVYVVADECFCVSGRELSRKIPEHPHFIGIYDPMKQFLINGVKFSAIIFHQELENLFNQWSDIVCGSLTISTVQAIEFFLSAEANHLHRSLRQADKMIQEHIKAIAFQYSDVFLDDDVDGHMMMCYIPKLSASHLHTFEDFFKFQNDTGVSIIPGTRFHFPKQDGFTFRINLARYDPLCFIRAIHRVLSYLSEV